MQHKLTPRSDVIEFIQTMVSTEEIRNLFMSGYCYHFAVILKDMFDGELKWHRGYGHIVCQIGDMCYDADGICDDYCPEDYVPIDALKESVETFKHRGHDFDIDNDMNCTSNLAGISIEKLYEWIYNKIPEDKRIKPYPNLGDAEVYWNTLKPEFTTEFNID